MTHDSAIALIEFKGTTLPVLAIMLRSLEPQALATASGTQFGDGVFFDGDLAVLDLSQLATWPTSIDWKTVVDLLTSHGLKVLGVTRCNSELASSAQSAGLPMLTLSTGRTAKPAAPPLAEPAPATGDLTKIPASLRKVVPNAASTTNAEPNTRGTDITPTEPSQDAPSQELIRNPANLIIDRPLRSGQQVYAKGGDLIILAAVNPGAEVIADGNIHIYAPLRGRALAGASGNVQARILTTSFGPELISIAGIYKTYEEGIPAQIASRPVQVRLVEEPGKTSTSNSSRLDVAAMRID